ncbi:hypothetical protein [Lutibacter sp.]
MKKIVILLTTLMLVSCNDGAFDIPAFDFTETINSCGEYVLYRTNADNTEVLVALLDTTQLGTTVGEASYDLIYPTSITYRIFDGAIGSNYFCETIPPATPNVVKDLAADNATINIVTSEIIENGVVTGYAYDITFLNLTFNDADERIYFESFFFGTFTRSI